MKNSEELIRKMRSFNRFYTNFIGVVDRHILESPYSLTDARVLYEISHTENCSAKKIRENVEIDEGYLSRIIERFIRKGLVKKSRLKEDRRTRVIVLTDKGRKEFAKLDTGSTNSVHGTVEKLSQKEREELVGLMERIQELLGKGQRDESIQK